MTEQEDEEHDNNQHPILEKIIEARQEGREKISVDEVEEAFEDDEETLQYIKEKVEPEEELPEEVRVEEPENSEDLENSWEGFNQDKGIVHRLKRWILRE